MYENLSMKAKTIHAGAEGGDVLCGKPPKEGEPSLFPYWGGVTCPACNEQRVLIKNQEDLDFANVVLSHLLRRLHSAHE
jgi:hypothetical protein